MATTPIEGGTAGFNPQANYPAQGVPAQRWTQGDATSQAVPTENAPQDRRAADRRGEWAERIGTAIVQYTQGWKAAAAYSDRAYRRAMGGDEADVAAGGQEVRETQSTGEDYAPVQTEMTEPIGQGDTTAAGDSAAAAGEASGHVSRIGDVEVITPTPVVLNQARGGMVRTMGSGGLFTIAGTIAGAYFGGPAGAKIGAAIGSKLDGAGEDEGGEQSSFADQYAGPAMKPIDMGSSPMVSSAIDNSANMATERPESAIPDARVATDPMSVFSREYKPFGRLN